MDNIVCYDFVAHTTLTKPGLGPQQTVGDDPGGERHGRGEEEPRPQAWPGARAIRGQGGQGAGEAGDQPQPRPGVGHHQAPGVAGGGDPGPIWEQTLKISQTMNIIINYHSTIELQKLLTSLDLLEEKVR